MWPGRSVCAIVACGLALCASAMAQVPSQEGFPAWTGLASRTISLGNLDEDDGLEIAGFSVAAAHMAVFNSDGSLLDGWSYPPPEFPLICHQELLHIGDINGDGLNEIVFTSCLERHFLFALDNTGALLPGWPVIVGDGSDEVGRIVLADVAGDESLEVIVQDWGGIHENR